MIKNNNNNNNTKNGSRFRSYTDINNYNNFLLELDKKNEEKNEEINEENNEENNEEKHEEKQITSCSNKCLNIECHNSSKNNIKTICKHIKKDFIASNYNDKNFTGFCKLETLINTLENQIDPNIYQSVTDNSPITSTIPIYTKKINIVNIVSEINNINDLLIIIDTYPNDKNTEYNIDIDALHKIKIPLIELQNMIGMKALKENIVDLIIFYIQKLHTLNSDIKGNDFMHTVIYGPPGSGKT